MTQTLRLPPANTGATAVPWHIARAEQGSNRPEKIYQYTVKSEPMMLSEAWKNTKRTEPTCADSKSVFPYSSESGFAPARVRRIALLWVTVTAAVASDGGRGRQILRAKPLDRGETVSTSPSVLPNLASSLIPAMLESKGGGGGGGGKGGL